MSLGKHATFGYTSARGPPQARIGVSPAPGLDAGFQLLYELKPAAARAQFAEWQTSHPGDPLGSVSEAASCLFEECYRQGVLTSEFFLDDKRLLGEVAVAPDAADAYLVLGAANYVIGSQALRKRLFLRFAARGRYLRPFAKILPAPAALAREADRFRQGAADGARRGVSAQPAFVGELAKLRDTTQP